MKSEQRRFTPGYVRLYESGELAVRVARAREMLRACTLCPHECRVNRLEGERGRCRSGALPMVSSHNVHMGEEPPLVEVEPAHHMRCHISIEELRQMQLTRPGQPVAGD
jgi:uncharacterized Fe-S radical SAM superfamily protein PflX